MKTLSGETQSGCNDSVQFNLGAKEQTQLGSYFRSKKEVMDMEYVIFFYIFHLFIHSKILRYSLSTVCYKVLFWALHTENQNK